MQERGRESRGGRRIIGKMEYSKSRHWRISALGMFLGGLTLLAAFAPQSSLAQSSTPREASWVTNGSVRAIASGNGLTYIGGDFTHIGPYTGSFAPIDAETGGLRPGFPKVGGAIYACVDDGTGGWYIGGDFTRVGDQTRNRVAHILSDGTVDPKWNPDADHGVRALAVSGSIVYVGGGFSTIAGQARTCLAALDTSTGEATSWNPIPGGGPNGTSIRCFAVSGPTVYVGGHFASIGGQARNSIAAFDAASGELLPWNPNADSAVDALAISGSTVYAGGYFTTVGGQTRNCIAALDAATGAVTPWDPNVSGGGAYGTYVPALAVSGSTIYIGGRFTKIGSASRSAVGAVDAGTGIATAWNPNVSGGGVFGTFVTALAVSGPTVYIGGGFTSIGGRNRNFIGAVSTTTGATTDWNPSAIRAVRAFAVSGSTVCAGGEFTSIGGVARNHVAAFDAVTGIATPWNPNANVGVLSLAVSGSTVYAGGGFSTIGGKARSRLAALDSTTGAATAWNPGANNLVYGIAVSGSKVYVRGPFTTAGWKAREGIAAIDAVTGIATDWIPDPTSGDYMGPSVRTIAASGPTVYLGGEFSTIGGQTRNHIAAFDGATGDITPWDPNASHYVDVLAISGTTLYATGGFYSIGGQSRTYLAALSMGTGKATDWYPVPGTPFSTLAASDTTIYGGGLFRTVGGMSRNRIAAIDATTGDVTPWDPGHPSEVLAIATSGSTVYVGGDMVNYVDDPRAAFAQFDSVGVPSGPGSGGARDLSTNSITWTWRDNASDETAFKVYAEPGLMAPITLRATTDPDVEDWRYDGLLTNTVHSFTALAINAEGASNTTADYTTWTLAAMPVAPIRDYPPFVSLSITIGSGDGNPAYTQYALHCATTDQWVQADGTLGPVPVWQTAATWGTTGVTGLRGGMVHAFSARARNGARVETVDGPFTTVYPHVTLEYTARTGGTITGESLQSFHWGDNGTSVTARPDPGYHFVEWSDGVQSDTRQDINVTQDINVAALFAMDPTPTPTPIPTLTPHPDDSDGDGVSDEYENAHNSDPNDPLSFPVVLDLDGNGILDANDAVRFHRQLTGADAFDPDLDYTLLDFDGDGRATLVDALLLYRNRVGRVPMIPLSH